MKSSGTVLLLADRRHSHTARALRNCGYRLMTTFTPDHAVAICVNNQVDAVVLDQEHFVVTEGWSVAQSLKMIRRDMCVILVVRGRIIRGWVPEGVDAVVPEGDADAVLKAVKKSLPRPRETQV